jgi:hypothetical protein
MFRLLRESLYILAAGCFAAGCAAPTPPKPPSTPVEPRAHRPPSKPHETALQVVERYLRGAPGYRQALADHRAGRKEKVEAFFKGAASAWRKTVDLERVDEFDAIRALQPAYTPPNCLQL